MPKVETEVNDDGGVGKDLDEFFEKEEAPVVEEKPVEVKVEVESKVEPKEEAKAEPKVEPKIEKKVVAKEEAEPEDDLVGMSDKELRSLARGLRNRVDDAHGKLVTAGIAVKPEQKVDTTIDAKTERKIEQKVEAEVINFLKDVNMDEVIDTPEGLNKLLVSVYNKAITDAESRAVEKVIRSIPQLVVNYATRHASMTELVREFYGENQDLASVKRTVATVANEVAAEHPDWEVKDVFKEAATKTRELLGIKKRDLVKPSDKGKDPALIRRQTGARKTPGSESSSMNDLQKEIAELTNL